MANSTAKNYTTQIARKFIEGYHSNTVTLNAVDRKIMPKGSINPQSGSTKEVKRPHQWKPTFTATGDLTSVDATPIIAATATMTVQDFMSEWVEWEVYEEAYELDQLGDGSSNQMTILGPIAEKFAVEEEIRFNQFIKDTAAHWTGTAGVGIRNWSDIANIGALCKSLGLPAGELFAEINPYDVKNLADVVKGIYSERKALSAWDEAMIGSRVAGVQAFMSNTLANHTVGTHGNETDLQLNAAPTQTYAGAKDNYLTTLVLKGANTSVTGYLKKGDVIKVTGKYWNQLHSKQQATGDNGGGIEYTGTVTADANSTAGGLVTVIVSGPAIYEAAGAYNTISAALAEDDAVTVISGASATVNTPNIWFHRKAYGFCPVVLPRLQSLDSTTISAGGLSIRVTKGSDFLGNSNRIRFDNLNAYVNYNPLWAGKFGGNS